MAKRINAKRKMAKAAPKPRKPRNYAATDITRIQLHRINDDLAALRMRVDALEARVAGGPLPTF